MTDREQRIEGVIDDITTLWRRLKLAMRSGAGPQALPYSQIEALMIISHTEPVSVKEIAGMMHVTASAATQLIEALVGEGLVGRQPSQDDRRVTHVTLTTAGKERIAALHRQRLEHVLPVLDGLTDGELDELGRLHRKMLGRLDGSLVTAENDEVKDA